jgi:hypothetical protein
VVSLTTDQGTLRKRLIDLGVSADVLESPTKTAYLTRLLGQRLAGEEPSVTRAATDAGLASNTIRVWRKRSPAFSHAEHRARYGVDLELPTDPDAPPEPTEVKELRRRLARAVDVCKAVGPGPWWRASPNEIQWNSASYRLNREDVISLIAELKAWDIHDHLPAVPPPLTDLPKPRKPRPEAPRPLWPPSMAHEADLVRLRGPRR